MENIIIRNYVPEDISEVIVVQKEYKKKYPNYSIRGAEVYTNHPAFEKGKNILCAFNINGKLIAYSPIFPAPVKDGSPEEYPHYLWTDIIYDPIDMELEIAMDLLLEKVKARAVEIKSTLPERKTRLASLKFINEEEGIKYFISNGFQHYDTMYYMNRNLEEPIEEVTTTGEVEIRRWKVSTEEDKLKYLNADNISNPNNPMSYEDLEWSVKGPWSVGCSIGAFDKNNNLLGSVMTYWFNNNEGITEEVFVIPQWRRKGIAKSMIKEALQYLRENGKIIAELEVRKSNEKAVNLYKKMGYKIAKEEWSLGMFI